MNQIAVLVLGLTFNKIIMITPGSFLVCFLSFPVTPLSLTFLSWLRYLATSILIRTVTLLYFGSQKTRLLSFESDLTTSKRVIGAPGFVRWEGIIGISTSVQLGQLNLISYGRTGIRIDLSLVDHMSFRVVKSFWAAKRRASDEVPIGLMNVRRLMNKQDEGLF